MTPTDKRSLEAVALELSGSWTELVRHVSQALSLKNAACGLSISVNVADRTRHESWTPFEIQRLINKRLSAHAKLVLQSLSRRLEDDLHRMADALAELSGVMSGGSEVRFILSPNERGNPVMNLHIDTGRMHPRPVKDRYFVRLVTEMDNLLKIHPETSPARTWIAGNARTNAATPEQAIWKWLCLNHRKIASELHSGRMSPSDKPVLKALEGRSLFEVFETGAVLQRALAQAPCRTT